MVGIFARTNPVPNASVLRRAAIVSALLLVFAVGWSERPRIRTRGSAGHGCRGRRSQTYMIDVLPQAGSVAMRPLRFDWHPGLIDQI